MYLILCAPHVPHTLCTLCTSYPLHPMYPILYAPRVPHTLSTTCTSYPMYLIVYALHVPHTLCTPSPCTSCTSYLIYPMYLIPQIPHSLCSPCTCYTMYPMYLSPYVPHVPGTVVQRSKIRDFFAPHPSLPPYYIVFEWSLKRKEKNTFQRNFFPHAKIFRLFRLSRTLLNWSYNRLYFRFFFLKSQTDEFVWVRVQFIIPFETLVKA